MASLVSGQTSAPLSSIIHADRNHRRSYTPATSSKTALQLHSHPLYSSSSVSCFAASSCSCSSSSIGGVPFFVFSLLFLLLFNLFLYFSSSILFIVFICSSFSLILIRSFPTLLHLLLHLLFLLLFVFLRSFLFCSSSHSL